MRRASRKALLVGTSALLVLVLVAFLVWPKPDTLAEWKAAQEARGESFSLPELTPAFSPECVKLEAVVSNAVNQLRCFPVAPGALALMNVNSNQRAPSLIAGPVLQLGPSQSLDWQTVDAQLASNGPVLRQIGLLLEHPSGGSARDYAAEGFAAGSFSLVQKRKLAQMLAAAVVVEAHAGRIAEAQGRLHTLFRLARWHENEDAFVGQMISVAIAGLGAAAAWEILQAPGWDEAQLVALQQDLEHASALPRFALSLRRERAGMVSALEQARTNRGGLGPFGVKAGGRSGFGDVVRDRIYAPVWRTAWASRDELRLLQSFAQVCDAVHAGVSNRSAIPMQALLDRHADYLEQRQGLLSRWCYPLSEIGEANWRTACQSWMRQETRLQLARGAVALERYHRETGEEPASLAALVPRFLSDLPWDFSVGAPLHYRRNPGGRYSLWGNGDNRQDDQGRGDDLIWAEPEPTAR